MPVWLNGQRMEASYSQTVVRQTKGSPLAGVLQVNCIDGDIKNYPTVLVQMQFCSAVGVVSQLDCLVLLGRDCPVLIAPLLHSHTVGSIEVKAVEARDHLTLDITLVQLTEWQ